MITATELRLGNYILHKTGVRIIPARCDFQHFDLLSKGAGKDVFPVVLKVDILQKCGFVENTKYPLLPDAREFILTLPIIGNGKNEIRAYIKNNKECFGRAMINDVPITNNFYNLHQLQNIYFALLGEELEIML